MAKLPDFFLLKAFGSVNPANIFSILKKCFNLTASTIFLEILKIPIESKKLLIDDHINHVLKKLDQFCGAIYKIRDVCPTKFFLLFYNSCTKTK